jgi:hypothetical protein
MTWTDRVWKSCGFAAMVLLHRFIQILLNFFTITDGFSKDNGPELFQASGTIFVKMLVVIDHVSGRTSFVGTHLSREGIQIIFIDPIVPVVAAPIDNGLWKELAKDLHVLSRDKRLRQDTGFVVGTRETHVVMLLEHFDALGNPSTRTKENIVPTLIEIVTSIVVGLSKETVPHTSQVSRRVVHRDKLET